jgi:Na+/proline symporter
MVITPFYWLIAPWYRRSERTTVGEIVEDRYGRKMGVLYSVFAILFFVFAQGAMLKGGGKVIAVATGDLISVHAIVVAMTIAFIVYSFFGGMIASAHANFIQALMIIVLSFMLIPFGLQAVNGFSGMRETLPDGFFNLYSSELGLGGFTILMLAINGIVGITAQPHMVSMCATGSTERAGRVGQTYVSFVKRLVTIRILKIRKWLSDLPPVNFYCLDLPD